MFIKFPSIDNFYQEKIISYWLTKFPELKDECFVITEKIHGTNFQLIVTPTDVKFASRNNLVDPNNFFSAGSLIVPKLQTFIERLHELFNSYNLKAQQELKVINVFGEFFGPGIQRGVYYGDYGYRVFAVYMVIENHNYSKSSPKRVERRWLSYGEVGNLISYYLGLNPDELQVPYIAMVDGLEAALNFDCRFNSKLVDVEGENICEGIVITPMYTEYVDEHGSRFAIKKKNKEFMEKSKAPTLDVSANLNEIKELNTLFLTYITDMRLQGIFSKEGMIQDKTEIGRYIRLLISDAINDFIKDNENLISGITAKNLNKVYNIGGCGYELIKKYL